MNWINHYCLCIDNNELYLNHNLFTEWLLRRRPTPPRPRPPLSFLRRCRFRGAMHSHIRAHNEKRLITARAALYTALPVLTVRALSHDKRIARKRLRSFRDPRHLAKWREERTGESRGQLHGAATPLPVLRTDKIYILRFCNDYRVTDTRINIRGIRSKTNTSGDDDIRNDFEKYSKIRFIVTRPFMSADRQIVNCRKWSRFLLVSTFRKINDSARSRTYLPAGSAFVSRMIASGDLAQIRALGTHNNKTASNNQQSRHCHFEISVAFKKGGFA